jgi:hypothetical protein
MSMPSVTEGGECIPFLARNGVRVQHRSRNTGRDGHCGHQAAFGGPFFKRASRAGRDPGTTAWARLAEKPNQDPQFLLPGSAFPAKDYASIFCLYERGESVSDIHHPALPMAGRNPGVICCLRIHKGKSLNLDGFT